MTNRECEWLQSDHSYVPGMIKIPQALPPPNMWKALDKTKLEACLKEVGDIRAYHTLARTDYT